MNLLIVEDNPFQILNISDRGDQFESLGISIKIATSFVEMCEFCNEGFRPDVAWVDHRLDGKKTGLDCISWLLVQNPEVRVLRRSSLCEPGYPEGIPYIRKTYPLRDLIPASLEWARSGNLLLNY